MNNILTIDVEEWYHAFFSQQKFIAKGKKYASRIHASINQILDLLEKKKTSATFFILGEIAEKHPELVKDIAGRKHEIAIHGYCHKKVTEMSAEEFRQDIQKARDCVKKITSIAPLGFRAPAFSLRRDMNWAFEILAKEGFRYDSSIFPTKNPLYGDPRAPRFPFWIEDASWKIKEIPPSTLKMLKLFLPVAGGFYLRSLPLSLVTYGIRKINQEGFPFVLYMHPWEIDTQQPILKGINPRERFTHYYNLSLMYKKLEYLLNNFKFGSIAEVENFN